MSLRLPGYISAKFFLVAHVIVCHELEPNQEDILAAWCLAFLKHGRTSVVGWH